MADDEAPTFVVLDDDDEPIAIGSPDPRPRGPRRRWTIHQRLAAAVAALVVIGIGVAVQRHRSSSVAPAAAPTVSASSTPSAGSPVGWPARLDVCGNSTLLPQVSIDASTAATKLRVSVGGAAVRQVDFDSGAADVVESPDLQPGQYVTQLVNVGSSHWVLAKSCGADGSTSVASLGAAGDQTNFGLGDVQELFPDGAGGIYGSEPVNPVTSGPQVTRLRRLDKASVVQLPASLTPLALHGTSLVGIAEGVDPEADVGRRLVVFDLTSKRVVRDLGDVSTVTASGGLVLWTSGACSASGACTIYTYDPTRNLRTSRDYFLPVEANVAGAELSPDHTRLAFQLPREFNDSRYLSDQPGTPSDIAVLDLRSGIVDTVPNVELAPLAQPALRFSADGRWLVIGLNEGSSTRLLAWRPGLAKAVESPALLPGSLQTPVVELVP